MIDGDIVIDDADKVVGSVNFAGIVTGRSGEVIGRSLSSDLAVDNNDAVLGRIYKIGTTILGNDGQYAGRLQFMTAASSPRRQNHRLSEEQRFVCQSG